MAACPGKKWYPVGKEKAGSLLDLVTLRFVTSGFEISACSSVKDANNGTHKALGPMCTMTAAWVPAVLCVAEPCWAHIPACLFRAMILRTDYSTSPRPSFPVFKAQKRTPYDTILQWLVFLYGLNPGTHACWASTLPLSHNPSHRVISKYCVG